MAALRHVLRRSRSNVSTLVNVLSQTELSLTYQGRRFLFSKDFLGLDNYERQRLVTSDRLGDVKHKFCERMESYMKGDNPGTVFTDDMKTMLHIAETEAEYDIVEKMYRRYVQQDSDLPVNEFMFGPVVLRLLYYMNKADTAFKLFTDKEFDGKFDSMTSFVLILDQLYEQGDYKKVLDVFEMIQQKNIRGIKYPNDSTTIALAACYKLNTEESFHTMLGVFKGCRERGIYLTPRSTSFAAMLALNQNRPDVAMEILVSRNEERILTSMNLKAIAYSRIGRLDDAMRLLKNILTRDLPEQYRRGNEVFRDTIKELEAAVQNSGNPGEMSRELQTVVQRLANGGHISDKSLDEFICQPILRQRTLQTSFKSRQRSVPQYQAYRREGLTDMN